jgi:hypothetical protein
MDVHGHTCHSLLQLLDHALRFMPGGSPPALIDALRVLKYVRAGATMALAASLGANVAVSRFASCQSIEDNVDLVGPAGEGLVVHSEGGHI